MANKKAGKAPKITAKYAAEKAAMTPAQRKKNAQLEENFTSAKRLNKETGAYSGDSGFKSPEK